MSRTLGQQIVAENIVVENIVGAGGTAVFAQAARANPAGPPN
jgi:tripartite-type tricarboxylate transporter receptor subunit TctC